MNRKTALVTAGISLAVVAATGAALPAIAADHATTITQHFTAKSSSSALTFGRAGFVLTDNDVKNGRTIGRDLLYCTNTATGASHCHLSFAEKGGVIYANVTLPSSSPVLKGTIIGGTGAFAHAKGSVTGRALSRTRTSITLKYTK